MFDKINLLIPYFARNPQKLFLLDSLGAFLTASLLAVISTFESSFGMPKPILYDLALLAIFYGIYSMACSLLLEKNWAAFIYILSIANVLYCLLCAGLVIYSYSQLTTWAILYFALEILVVSGLVCIEQKTAQSILGKEWIC